LWVLTLRMSEEHLTSIFMAVEYTKRETSRGKLSLKSSIQIRHSSYDICNHVLKNNKHEYSIHQVQSNVI
jgi:hypothetical protein